MGFEIRFPGGVGRCPASAGGVRIEPDEVAQSPLLAVGEIAVAAPEHRSPVARVSQGLPADAIAFLVAGGGAIARKTRCRRNFPVNGVKKSVRIPVADGIEVAGEEFPVEVLGKTLNSQSSQVFDFPFFQVHLSRTEVSIGIVTDIAQECRHPTVIKGWLLGWGVGRWVADF